MDAYEATSVVFSRIQSLDPENASKIMGFILIQDPGEKEMIRLALGPDTLLKSVVLKALNELLRPSNALSSTPTSPFLSRQSSLASPRLPGLPPPSLAIPRPSLPAWDAALSDFQSPDDSIGKSCCFCPSFRPPPKNGFSNPPMAGPVSPSAFCAGSDLIDDIQIQDQQLYGGGDAVLFPSYGGGDLLHRRSCSLSDIPFGGDDLGWKPCLYFARGFCKNGTSCRFLHGGDSDPVCSRLEMMEPSPSPSPCELLSSKCAPQQRLAAAMANSYPYSPTKCMSFPKHGDTQRALMMAEEAPRFGRPRLDCSVGMATPSSRQIYLTFPADSTFREEDVSNYFSNYGPVQDVRIPYQQKRMFGFVTFIYPDTVKFILAKGNPHFVCHSRVLVKPYKEKGKVLDKKQQQQVDRMEFTSPCSTPTGLDSTREPLDFQPGPRGLFNGPDVLWRKKMEEQAMEQGRRLMGLQLLDVKKPFSNPAAPPKSPTLHPRAPQAAENCSIPSCDKESTDCLEESFEHNLPDSPFASPTKTKAMSSSTPATGEAVMMSSSSSASITPSLLLASSALDMASLKSCYFPVPRFPPSQETIEM